MAFTSGHDVVAVAAAVKKAENLIVLYQENQTESEKALFPNHTRVRSLEQRYRGEERRERLRELKGIWDPEGIFSRQLL